MITQKRVIILCGGSGTRWNNYRGTPKQLLTIEGEVLLERTVRQFSRYTDNLVVVSNDNLKIGDADFYPTLPVKEEWNDLKKIYSSHYLWSDTGTILVFGDVYFTDNTVELIMNNDDDIKFFLRDRHSSYTGKAYREIFAIAFNSSLNKIILDFITQSLYSSIDKGGWTLFEFMKDMYKNLYKKIYVNIDDWTDDFDYPVDLLAWEIMRSAHTINGSIENNCLITA